MRRLTERTANKEAIREILRKHQNAKKYTQISIGEESGVGGTRSRGHLEHNGVNTPTVVDFLMYAELLGPEFVNEVLAIIGMGGARRMSRIMLCPFHFHAASTAWASEQAMALADRVLDHQEKLHLAPIALERAEANWQFHQFLTGAN
jgi:hypothetical protein